MKRGRKSRKKAPKFVPTIDVDSWLAANPEAMFECPSQPGRLRLRPEACAKRHMTANEPRWSNIGAEPFNIFVFKMNLIACRECEIGQAMARKIQEQAA